MSVGHLNVFEKISMQIFCLVFNRSIFCCWVIEFFICFYIKPLIRYVQFSSVQSLSRVWLFATPWIAARQASLSNTISRSSLRLTSIQSVMPSSHFILRRPLLLLPPIPPSIRVFSNESTLCMRCPKYWSFSLTSFLPKKSQGWSPSEWTGWSPCSPRVSQESSTPQLKSINSSVLSFLHSPTLTCIHDHWKNHSLD